MAQDEWNTSPAYAPRDCTSVTERENARVVIYDANGQMYSRPPQPIGFDLTPKEKRK